MQYSAQQAELIDICPDPVIAVNGQGVITVFNPAAERLLGYDAEKIINTMNICLLYASDGEAYNISKMMSDGAGRIEGYETSILSGDKRVVPIRLSAAMLEPEGSIGFFHDMTQQKKLEATLKTQSITDELSGLFNQRHFYTQLAKEMARAKRYDNQMSVVCIDLDGFKAVNDQLGHLEGDQIIRQIGEVLTDGLRDSDQAFRYGGDEFMLILPCTNSDDARIMAERVRKRFNTACAYSPEHINDSGIMVSMSLGIATCVGEAPLDHFIQQADMAMYQAKQSGGDCALLFHGHSD